MNDQATQLRSLVQAGATERESAPGQAWPGGAVPRGLVSFGPAGVPRHRSVTGRSSNPPRVELARAIAVTSGKGGVGKTNIAVNLAMCAAQLGLKVCLIDGDLGLANADVLCNLTPRLTLEHVIAGRCRLSEIMLRAPGGFRLIPGASGVARLAELGPREREALMLQLAAVDRVADLVIIDTGAGISENVLSFASAAHLVLVVTTPEPTAITDAYGMIKALSGRCAVTGQERSARLELVVNMASSEADGRSVFGRLDRVSKAFLNRSMGYGGTIPWDPALREAVRHRVPLMAHSPRSPAAREVRRLAQSLANTRKSSDDGAAVRTGFFARLAGWMGKAGAPRPRSGAGAAAQRATAPNGGLIQ